MWLYIIFWLVFSSSTVDSFDVPLNYTFITPPVSSAEVEAASSCCKEIMSALEDAKVSHSVWDHDFISSRDYYNVKLDRSRPRCIAYPEDAQDVSIILKKIRSSGAKFAIKAGGHNTNYGFSAINQGVLIDLKRMTKKSYNSTSTLATYEPGNKFSEVYDYLLPYNRTVVGARLGGVGTGLALSGGRYGLACDSFRELEIVLPSGDIVNASQHENPDLFYALRGGGGNLYGVVTKYTVQSWPAYTFTSGNVVYLFQKSTELMNAITNFTVYNTDPKAAIIGTFEKLPTFSFGLDLDELAILFLVYDGTDPGDVFKNFTDIPHLINTVKHRDYVGTTELPIDGAANLGSGFDIFRVNVQRPDAATLIKLHELWNDWSEKHKGKYGLLELGIQPVSKHLTDASKNNHGGNAMEMVDGPYVWIEFLMGTLPGLPNDELTKLHESFKEMTETIKPAEGLPMFVNDAAKDQEALRTYGGFKKLQEIKKKYDPDGFFTNQTVGWSLEDF
ncbi:hypothetical protein KEM54_003846 [Ascosphaera aggregata]|nr:hypothetical protein KEM54_003846 [Ascosphaera aggregata]